MAQQFQSLRGMPDILPDDQRKYQYVTATFERLASQAGFQPIKTPYVEDAQLFIRGVGSETDAVKKEMYEFSDRSDHHIALRPEPTAGMVRAYIQHGMASLPQPVKLQSVATSFRYERPQAGRLRQFQQADVEVLGDASPSVDAQLIGLALRLYRTLGLRGISVKINTLGDLIDRKNYLTALVAFLKEHEGELADIDRERLATNPLRVLDTKEHATKLVIKHAPKIEEHLSDASKAHFAAVLEYLEVMGVSYEVDPYLVRGLDYYTHTVFEFYGERAGSQSALGAGGRYNGLVEQLGGASTPAAGFGIGIERVLLELEEEGVVLPFEDSVKLYVASLGGAARVAAFTLIEQLLDSGVGAVGAVDKDGIGAQLERANKLGVPYALIIGQKEVQENSVILRDMKSGAQEMLPLKTIVKSLQQRFSR